MLNLFFSSFFGVISEVKIHPIKQASKTYWNPGLHRHPSPWEIGSWRLFKFIQVDPSIGVHNNLTLLSLKGYKNLKTLPNKFKMKSLETLILSGCLKILIKKIPKFGKNMQCVLKVYLDGIAITKLPMSIGHLIGLAYWMKEIAIVLHRGAHQTA